MTSGGDDFNGFPKNQLTKFCSLNMGDKSGVGERFAQVGGSSHIQFTRK